MPENAIVFLQCLECYFFKTKEENSPHFQDQNEKIPYWNDNSGCSMRNIVVQCADQYPAINVPFTVLVNSFTHVDALLLY